MPCLTSSFVVKCLAFFWTMMLWPSFFFSQSFEVLLILSKPSMHDDYPFFISLSLHIPHLFKAYLPTSQESSSSAIIFCASIHLAVTLTFFHRTQSYGLMDYLIRTPNHLYYLHSLYLGSRASVLCFIPQRWLLLVRTCFSFSQVPFEEQHPCSAMDVLWVLPGRWAFQLNRLNLQCILVSLYSCPSIYF